VICLINFSILPPHQSQEAPARQKATLPHTAVLDTSGSCFAVLIIPLATSRTAATYSPVSPPLLTPATGPKYHRPHPQQSAGQRPLSRPPLYHINRQEIHRQTGFKINGEKWWLWIFRTNDDETLVVIRKSMGRKVLDEILGKDHLGPHIVDGWSAYCKTAILQRCWSHCQRRSRHVKRHQNMENSCRKRYMLVSRN